MIPDIDIWRCVAVMIKHYGCTADIEAAARADEYEAKRDIVITEKWIDFWLGDRKYEKVTANSSGKPSNVDVTFCWKDGTTRTVESVEFQRHPQDDHTFGSNSAI